MSTALVRASGESHHAGTDLLASEAALLATRCDPWAPEVDIASVSRATG